ncbi:MAG: glycosyltransferase family protein [Alphaproteobacteria bacterium]|nr:glycosyltransferase family protein [Alphaproteobacteria bacterium]
MTDTSASSEQNLSPEQQRVKIEQGVENCRILLRNNPGNHELLHVMGMMEAQLGRWAEAETHLLQAENLAPQVKIIAYHRGVVLTSLGRFDEARQLFETALAHGIDYPDVHYNLGNALKHFGRTEEAKQQYQIAIDKQPTHVMALNNLANILKDEGAFDKAIALYQRAIATDPAYARAQYNLGIAYVSLGLLDEAEKHYHKALELEPNYPEALNNLGIICRLRGQFYESRAWYEKSLALRPHYDEALNNLGNALHDCGESEEAIIRYRQAILMRDTPDYHHNMSLALLATGQLEEGWRVYEARWYGGQLSHVRRDYKQPVWRGEAGQGRTLYVYAEQGFGDTIQFCRYAPILAEKGWRVVLEVQRPLLRLMQSLQGVAQVLATGDAPPDFDMHCPTMSLPIGCKTNTVADIPADIPYLQATPDDVTRWKEKLSTAEMGDKPSLRVGLVWSGNPRMHSPEMSAVNSRRSMQAECLVPIMGIPGVRYYSLQKGVEAPADFHLIDLMNDCNDFADTAALISNLDLVISVDTAVAHLAGALGKPIWMLNRFDSCWRWLQNRDDSPWYPHILRQFRQQKPGDWAGVMGRVADTLKLLAQGVTAARD